MRILIAIENEKDGYRVVDYLGARALEPSDEYMILSCVQPSDMDDFCTAVYGYDTQRDALEKRVYAAKKVVECVEQYFRSKVSANVQSKVEVGEPKDVIVAIARDWKAGEVAVGTHSRHGLDKIIMGSVSEAVACQAPCTVAVIK